MPYYPMIRHFLSTHHGYYCVDRLATMLHLPVTDVPSMGQRTFAEITATYRICQSCLEEKAVFALPACA